MMKYSRRLSALIAGAAIFFSTQAIADDFDERWYLVPGVSYLFSDNDRTADDNAIYRLGIGKPVHEYWNLELNAVYDKLDFKVGTNSYDQFGGTLDALLFLNRDRTFAPYLLAGGGVLHTKVQANSSTNALVNVGAGIMSTFTDSGIGARVEGRYRFDFDDSSLATQSQFQDWEIGLRLVIPLGETAAAAAPVAAVVSEPVSEPVEVDDDRDGVNNNLDRCPGTPIGTPVNEYGCELDSDSDGVKDSIDQCPNTAAGARVDSRGCEILEIIELKGVTFATDSAELAGNSTTRLDNAVRTLQRYTEIYVEVAGHTSNTASAAYNLVLSQKRALTVRDYLMGHGVAAARLSARGYGLTKPIASNNTPEGRAANRRVELRILK